MAFHKIIFKRRWSLCVFLTMAFSFYVFLPSIYVRIQNANGYNKWRKRGELVASKYTVAPHHAKVSDTVHDIASGITNTTEKYNKMETMKTTAHNNWKACDDNCMEVRPWLEKNSKFYTILSSAHIFCNGSVVLYDSKSALLYDMVIDGSAISSKIGGEELKQVIGQPEMKEAINFNNGVINIGQTCSEKDYRDLATLTRKEITLYPFFSVISSNRLFTNVTTVRELTIAILRKEYANLYWTMIDLYNVFLVSKAFGVDVSEMKVLFLDGHPEGKMDAAWRKLFGSPLRMGKLNSFMKFKRLFLLMDRRHTPIVEGVQSLPFINDFRAAVHKKFNIDIKQRHSCKEESVSILFIFRRNYVAHPRNPSGKISRKITNEAELLNSTRSAFPQYSIKGAQMDNVSMDEQIHLLANTSILIGMHGAGLAHVMLLRPKSGLIELFPMRTVNDHFESMARWSGVLYTSWRNGDISHEDQDQNIYIPPVICITLIKKMVNIMCVDN